jgi:uncharacterized protein YigE (DUF2233 family)
MKRTLGLLSILLLSFIVGAGATRKSTQVLMLGETEIRVNIYENDGGRVTFFAPHHNEQQGIRLAKEIVDAKGGRLIEIESFDERGKPIGLMVENGKQVHAINLKAGGGNFHLMPNGVFLVRKDGRSEVVTSKAYKPSPDIRFATQSGPMLVIEGKLHPKFDVDGTSRYVRNGVGVGRDGKALFVISEDSVSFGKFARFFRDQLKVRNALYVDGSVSSLWDPANGRMDSFTELGPMVVAFKPAVSKPGREGRAKP